MRNKIVPFVVGLLLTLVSCADMGHQMVESYMNPYGVAQYRATFKSVNLDFAGAIKDWEEALPSYGDGSWPLTKAKIYMNIGEIHWMNKHDVGELPSVAEKLKEQVEIIKQRGIENVNDSGEGYRLNDPAIQMSHGQYANTMKNMQFSMVHNRDKFLLSQYYDIIGNTSKSHSILSEMGDEDSQLRKELNLEAEAKAMRQDAEAIVAQDPKVHEVYQSGEKSTKDGIARSNEINRLSNQISKKLYDSDKHLDELLSKLVELMIEDETRPLGGTDLYSNIGDNTWSIDIRSLDNHYKENILIPWGRGLKATFYFQLGKYEQAKAEFESAYVAIAKKKNLPKLNNDKSAYSHIIDKINTKDFITWEILRALIYSKNGDQRALESWQDVMTEMSAREAGKSDQLTATTSLNYHTNIKEDLALLTYRRSIEDLKKYGDKRDSLAFLENLLERKEEMRSSINLESDKRNFLANNLEIYDIFVDASEGSPEKNLIGMERAKSRAMIDLMSGGVKPIYNQDSRDYLPSTGNFKKTIDGKRGISIVRQNEEKINAQYPDFYTSAAEDVDNSRSLKSLLKEDEVAISYYLTKDNLFINVLAGSPKKLIDIGEVDSNQKVISRTLSRASIAEAVHGFNSALIDGNRQFFDAEKSVSISLESNDNGDIIYVLNNTSLPIHIYDVSMHADSLNTFSLGAPYLPLSKSYSFPVDINNNSIEPGRREIVAKFDFGGETDTSRPEGIQQQSITVKTNLGDLHIVTESKVAVGEFRQSKIIDKEDIVFENLSDSLYNILIKPVESLLTNKKLVISPHGPLHSLPFEALQDENGNYLIQKHPITYVPSLNVLKQLDTKESPKFSKLVAYGNTLGDLEFAQVEIETISRMFDDSIKLLGGDVSRESINSTIDKGDVVHFAAHGVFNKWSPLESGIVISEKIKRSESNRDLSDLDNLNIYRVYDVMTLSINPELVFLSACETGRAEISNGDELIGLIRGFFTAGANSVINTLWSIDDKSTALLVEKFYDNIFNNKLSKAEALQKAKIYMIENGYEQPFYWAPFILHGSPL